jgi:hypothetical protein
LNLLQFRKIHSVIKRFSRPAAHGHGHELRNKRQPRATISKLEQTMNRLTQHSVFIILLILASLSIGRATAAPDKARAVPALPSVVFLGEATGTVDPATDTCTMIGQPVPPTFKNIFAITRGGTVINVAPGLGTQLGEVYRIEGNSFALGFFGYLAPGVLLEIRSTLNLGEDSGDFLALVSQADGTPICQYAGNTEARPLSAQPFPEDFYSE